ncbi:unnamed protein product [Lactuca virosa]|uniref:Uncharacterized protein n=1 Tax=Lactuca virosa TaxID=75947 RepID=A0AAU9PB67_9ASTR|nr:unnamed protein product [Lactuca virosa]
MKIMKKKVAGEEQTRDFKSKCLLASHRIVLPNNPFLHRFWCVCVLESFIRQTCKSILEYVFVCVYVSVKEKRGQSSLATVSASREALGLGGKYRQAKSVSAKDLENTNRQTYQSSRQPKYVEIEEPLIDWLKLLHVFAILSNNPNSDLCYFKCLRLYGGLLISEWGFGDLLYVPHHIQMVIVATGLRAIMYELKGSSGYEIYSVVDKSIIEESRYCSQMNSYCA